MSSARAAATVTWVYALGFGLATAPVSIYWLRSGQLPRFFGLFEMFGGPWSARTSDRTFVGLLLFCAVTLVAFCSAWLLWQGGGMVLYSTWQYSRLKPSSGSASHCPFRGRPVSRESSSSPSPGTRSPSPASGPARALTALSALTNHQRGTTRIRACGLRNAREPHVGHNAARVAGVRAPPAHSETSSTKGVPSVQTDAASASCPGRMTVRQSFGALACMRGRQARASVVRATPGLYR